jgi:hypothetical protein
MSQIFELDGKFPAWNIIGSSDALPPMGFSWITWAEYLTGKTRGRCSYNDCNNYATCGGHLWIKTLGCCIAPICSSCNYSENPSRKKEGNSILRNKIYVIKVDMTDGMKNSNKIMKPDNFKNKKCVNCNVNFIPKKPNHKRCNSCASSYLSHRNIHGPW